MAGATQKKAEPAKGTASEEESPKRTRTTYSDEEKLAQAEARVAEIRERNAEKKAKAIEKLDDEITKLDAKVDEARLKVAEKKAERERLAGGDPIVPMDDGGALSQVSGESTDEDDSES